MTTPNKDQELTPLQQRVVARKLLEAEIIAHAWTDNAFCAQLEVDPASALAEAGIPIPKGRVIQILTETPDTLTLVIPARPQESQEANNEELAAVAGGGTIIHGQCTALKDFKEARQKNDIGGMAKGFAKQGFGVLVGISWLWG